MPQKNQPIPKVVVCKTTVFNLKSRTPEVTPTSTCGDLLDFASGICLANPEFLRKSDKDRYSFQLQCLKSWKVGGLGRRTLPPVTLAACPLQSFSYFLGEWVMSHFKQDNPLMPHYALDLACFLQFVVHGTDRLEPSRWILKPSVGTAVQRLGLFDFLDKTFKKTFTEKIRLEVRAKLPRNVSVTYQGEQALPMDAEFAFRVRRCHLSAIQNEFRFFEVTRDPSTPEFDLVEDFKLNGILLPNVGDAGTKHKEIPFDLPVSWITHVLIPDSEGIVKERVPTLPWA